MKLGILGAGMIVREFLPWLTGPESPFKVEALCSTERSAGAAQALCDQYGVPRHTTSYDELLSLVDVVYIAVPNILHVKYARAALEAGRHVIVEKPMAPTAAQAEELAELARSKRLFLFEAVTTQYQDNYAKIREVLPKVGAVTMVQCNFSQYSSRYHDFCAGKVWPSFDPACAGGALMDLGVYNVSYVVGLFGSPNKVHYAANVTRGIDTSGVLTMEYRSFKAVSIRTAVPRPGTSFRVPRGICSRNPPPTSAAASPSTPIRARKNTSTSAQAVPGRRRSSTPLPAPSRARIWSFAAGCWTPRWPSAVCWKRPAAMRASASLLIYNAIPGSSLTKHPVYFRLYSTKDPVYFTGRFAPYPTI